MVSVDARLDTVGRRDTFLILISRVTSVYLQLYCCYYYYYYYYCCITLAHSRYYIYYYIVLHKRVFLLATFKDGFNFIV
jgi:hypothetical protein